MRIQRRRVRRDLRLFKHHVEIKAGPPPPAEESSKSQPEEKSGSREEKSNSAATKEGADAGGGSRSKDDSGNGSSRYEDRTMDDLLKRAAELGIEGRSNMNKEQLIEALRK